jgi:hypothetical protein
MNEKKRVIPSEAYLLPFPKNDATDKPIGRPKLLFLSWRFPPVRSVACVRTWNIAKYLSRLGWEVTIVTPRPSLWVNLENPDGVDAALSRENVKRIFTNHNWRCLLPEDLVGRNWKYSRFIGRVYRRLARDFGVDNGIGWIKPAEKACSKLRPGEIDLIFATGSPFSSFRLAKRLSKRLGCPYILDYRDPWTENPHGTSPIRPSVIREEGRLLEGSAAVTIVSPTWASALDKRFGLGEKLHVVQNGFDPEELGPIKPIEFGHFAIVYSGTFYPPKRTITPVMAAIRSLMELSLLNSQEDKWYFHYYGEQENHVREEASRFGVMERVVIHGRVPRMQALSAVAGADVAVVISMVGAECTEAEKGMVTAKLYETIGLGTRVLLIAPPGSDPGTIIERVGIGQRITGTDIQGIVQFLLEQARAKGEPHLAVDQYAWPNHARKLHRIMKGIIGEKSYRWETQGS